MTSEIGWNFPPTNGGTEDGFNHPGIAHFDGAHIESLAREMIQNSLDARKSSDTPVEMSFELVHPRADEIGGAELCAALKSSRMRAEELDDFKARGALAKAEKIVGGRHICCLKVSDSNTTGLHDVNWKALVKMQGISQKDAQLGAGGSHGIGKFASFAVSRARAVFYSTRYETEDGVFERFQGKAVLMSHDHEGSRRQGTGFYGIKANCSDVPRSDMNLIAPVLRIPYRNDTSVCGTSITIVGFANTASWRERVACSIIENYFFAINANQLTVVLEPEADEAEYFESEISLRNLGFWFDRLVEDSPKDPNDHEFSAIERAKAYWELLQHDISPVREEIADFGQCSLYINVGEGLPRRVALVRLTGMLITDEQPGMPRFSGFRDFVAMCVFEDLQGNDLLRKMENPRHDRFEPERMLDEDDRKRAKRSLKRLRRWILDEIRKRAGPLEVDQSTELPELASLLPELYPDEPLDDHDPANAQWEQGFGDRYTVTLKPVRKSGLATSSTDEDADDDGYGDDSGSQGGGGVETAGGGNAPGGTGDGEGEGGTGGRSGGSVGKTLKVSSVRMVPLGGSENRYRLSFRCEGNNACRIKIYEAGDSSTAPLDGLVGANGKPLDVVTLSANNPTTVEIRSKLPIHDRAIQIVATDVLPNSTEQDQ